jgi:2-oxoglutarate dehydrogenase E2 component (dihydrolipoamide succinyltransferase)
MPQLGESVVEGTISRWLKQEGDLIEEMESLLEVNTDKVDSEIPSPASGTLLKILVAEGETVNAGTIIAWIGQPGEEIPSSEAKPEKGAPAPDASGHGAGRPAEALQETATAPLQAAAADLLAAGDRAGSSGGSSTSATAAAAPRTAGRSRDLGFISPIVAKLAQEHTIDLSQVSGTGEGGRITKKDVLAYLEHRPPRGKLTEEEAAPWETPGEGDLFRPTEMVFAKGRPETGQPAPPAQQVQQAPSPAEGRLIPHSTMRRRIAEHMVASKRTAPHVTTVMEADLHRVLEHYHANKAALAGEGVKLTYTAYFVSAAAAALRAFPNVNASWTEEGLLIHPNIHIGLAVSLGEEGLIVPVLKNAGDYSLAGLARTIGDIAARARAHKLAPDEVRGGTFTITNHGISGSLFATPVINQPQCGILGVGAVQKRVVVRSDSAGGDVIAIRPMVYLSLTFDHRILDGASADGFLAKVVEGLENWR